MRVKLFLGVVLAASGTIAVTPLWADSPSTSPGSLLSHSSNSALIATLALAQTTGTAIGEEARQKINEYSNASSWADLKKMAVIAGVPAEEGKGSLNQILERNQPAVLQLKNPDQFVLLLDSVQDEEGKSELRLLQNLESTVSVVSRSELQPRFAGVALLPKIKTETNAAHIQLASRDYHFKIRNVGEPVEHSYKFINTGKSNLNVQLTKTYCGCGGSVKFEILGGEALKPGEGGEVRVTYAVPTAAAVNETTTLLTNDPAHPQVFLTIRGEPARKLEVSTQQMNFEAQKGKSVEQSFEVSGLPSLMLGQPMLDNDKFSATAARIFQDNEKATWRVTVKLNNKMAGQHQSTLTVPTNDPDNGTITVPISAKVM